MLEDNVSEPGKRSVLTLAAAICSFVALGLRFAYFKLPPFSFDFNGIREMAYQLYLILVFLAFLLLPVSAILCYVNRNAKSARYLCALPVLLLWLSFLFPVIRDVANLLAMGMNYVTDFNYWRLFVPYFLIMVLTFALFVLFSLTAAGKMKSSLPVLFVGIILGFLYFAHTLDAVIRFAFFLNRIVDTGCVLLFLAALMLAAISFPKKKAARMRAPQDVWQNAAEADGFSYNSAPVEQTRPPVYRSANHNRIPEPAKTPAVPVPHPIVPSEAQKTSPNNMEAMKQITQLFEEGLISLEEFDRKKKEILDRI